MNNYEKQAYVWDWDAYDDTEEYEYWCKHAERFGKKVLIPMCSHGQIGAFMAGRSFQVVGFDITPEMISEGKKRYGSVDGLELVVADIFDLDLPQKDFDFVFIAGYGDFHLFQSVQEIRAALRALHRHMRDGAGLVLEVTLPGGESWSSPKRVFHPRVPRYADKKICKENESRYDAAEKRLFISQTVYVEDADGVESFVQDVCLQYYEREVLVGLLGECGFEVVGEGDGRGGVQLVSVATKILASKAQIE